MEWNVWGYNILTDIYNQMIIEDPYGIAQNWKARLQVYPEALEKAIVKKYASSLRYWRQDYHFRNKVNRKDAVFLASITTRLVNDLMQVIYALNHFYFPGDGMNLVYSKEFKTKPDRLEERVVRALYPDKTDEIFKDQYETIIGLIDDTLKLTL
jgi:hypothetical protein